MSHHTSKPQYLDPGIIMCPVSVPIPFLERSFCGQISEGSLFLGDKTGARVLQLIFSEAQVFLTPLSHRLSVRHVMWTVCCRS